MKLILTLAVALAAGISTVFARPFEPSAIVLTWQSDPATTMTIDWHSVDGAHGEFELVEVDSHVERNEQPILVPMPSQVRAADLEYRRLGESRWTRASGQTLPFPHIEIRGEFHLNEFYRKALGERQLRGMHRDGNSQPFPPQGRSVHRVELTGLSPATTYEFRFDAQGEIHRFRTMPGTLDREVRIAMGGDVGFGAWAERMNHLVASHDPDFVVWGGDIAYADGQQERLGRWYDFFDSKTRSLVTADGRRIPVLVAIGNHETLGGYHTSSAVQQVTGKPYSQDDDGRQRIAPYFYTFFAFPGQPGYNVLDFGDYLSIILLDSGHSNPIGGAQAEWLDRTLQERRDVPHIFPSYHVPAFPSSRSLSDSRVVAAREHWVPLFEKHNLPVVFENHDHNYKRTFPIRDGKKDPEGVTYLGDGSWGVVVTGVGDRQERWYLEEAIPVNHFILVRLQGNEAHAQAINLKGTVIDEHVARRRGF